MAVEIPVVVNIDEAFAAAARRVPAAVSPLRNAISGLNEDLSAWKDILDNSPIDSDDFKQAAKEIQNISQALGVVNDKFIKLSTNENSIKRINAELASLRRRWEEMGSAQKFDASGNLSNDAQQMVDRYRQLTDEAKRYGRTLEEYADRGTVSLQKQQGVLSKLSSTFASYFSVYAVIRFAKQVRDVTGELEFQRVALGRLIQDEEYGAQLFEQIKEQAVKSPFRIQQLVTYTKQLAAYRIEQEELFDTTQRLADISAGLGVEMNRLILAYGQVRSASVLRGQELRQFTEAGIPLVQLLADKFTELNGKAVRTADVFELISKRAVPFSMISEIFEDLTDKGGMFYKMQEKQADTLKGRWEKLKDAFDIGLQSIGDTKTFEFYNKVFVESLTFLAKNLRVVPKLIEGISFAWGVYYIATTRARIATRRVAAEEIKETTAKEAQAIANIRGIKHVDAYTAALVRQRVATNALSKTFWRLWAAIVANPIGAALAALAGVASALFLFRKRTDEAASAYKDLDELIEQTSRGLKDTSKIDTLISRYESLARKTDLSVKESNRLYQTMTLLQEAFPNLQVGVEGTTDSIEEQVKKMRELNEERRKELLMRGEEKFQALQDEIVQKEKTRNKLYKEQNRLRSNLAQNVAEKGSEAQKKWTKELDNTNDQLNEMDKELSGLQKRLQSLDRILHPEDVNKAFNAWQRFIKENSGINVNGISTSLFDDEQIEKWENLDAALDEIGKRKKKAQELEDALSESIKNQTGEIREQIQAELDWARAERLRLQWLENWFRNPNVLQKDISDNFKILMQKTFDEGNLKQYGQNLLNYLYMQTGVLPDPQLLSRPLVDAAELVAKGWKDAGEGIATVYSSVYDWEDEQGNKHNIMVTPILPDGSVLSPEELDEYVDSVIGDSEHKDPKKLVLGFDVSDDAGERLHEMQEEFYHLVQMREELPEKFLFTDKDIAGIKEATDVISLADSKIASIEKELEAVRNVNIENLDDSEIRKTAEYEKNLKEIYEWLVKLRDKFKVQLEFPDIAQDIVDNFDEILGRNFKNEGGVTIPVEFLITDKELQALYNVGDLFDLLDKKISGIEKEIEKVNEQKIDPNVSEEVIEQSELYRLSLENVYQTLLKIQGRYRDQLSDIAKDVKDAFPDLMASAYRMEGKSGYATQGLFSDDELKRIRNVVDLYDIWSSKIQAVRKAKENFNKQFSTAIDEQTRKNARAAIDSLDEQEKKLVEFMTRYGFILRAGTTGGSEQDPWIILYKNRMKFMQDFQKGVEDLDKYLSHSASLGREQGIMKGRGLSLGIDTAKLRGDAEELRKWYSDAIDAVVKKIQSMGGKQFAGLGVTEILAKDLTGRKVQKYQELLQELWKGLTDFDTNQIKKEIDENLNRVKEEIKRSEAAKNFFSDILSTTGDEDLAQNLTVSVYGDPGAELGDRIKAEIEKTLSSLNIAGGTGIGKDLLQAADEMDFRSIMKDIDKLPQELQDVVRRADAAIRKSNEETAKSYAKLLMQFDEIEQQRVNISQKAAKEQEDIEKGLQLELKALREKGASEEEQQAAKDRARLAKEAIDRNTKLELSRLQADYRLFFSSVGVISEKAARKIAEAQKVALTDQFVRGEISLARYKRELRELDEQLQKYKGWDMLENFLSGKWGNVITEQLSNYTDGLLGLASTLKTEGGIWTPNEQSKKFLEDVDRVLNAGNFAAIFKKGAKISIVAQANAAAKKAYNDAKLRGESEKMANKAAAEAAKSALSDAAKKATATQAAFQDFTNAFAIIVKMFSSFANMVEEYEDDIIRSTGDYSSRAKKVVLNVNGVEQELNITGRELSEALISLGTAWDKIKNMDLYGGVRELYLGFSGINARVKTANEDIAIQNRRIKDLEYAYDRLGVALEESFGSDYIANYNQQLVVLRAQAEAYRAQAEAERSKGKKADEETARGFEDSAKDVEDTINDMKNQVSEFMSSTDLTSSARDFASAWIEAYKEFGSTTDAMKGKFNEMIENMVVNSLAAQLIQGILKPIFDAIDTASADGALSAADIANISAMIPERLNMIDGSMNTLMNQLTAAGINLRAQAGTLTGISRDIAGASEESINGLAAGINTQNFYMQHIDMNVTAILAALTGGTTSAQSGSTGEFVDPYKDAMLSYAQHIPDIHVSLLDILGELRSVITLNGTKRAVEVKMS